MINNVKISYEIKENDLIIGVTYLNNDILEHKELIYKEIFNKDKWLNVDRITVDVYNDIVEIFESENCFLELTSDFYDLLSEYMENINKLINED